jgi:hypothetical protein
VLVISCLLPVLRLPPPRFVPLSVDANATMSSLLPASRRAPLVLAGSRSPATLSALPALQARYKSGAKKIQPKTSARNVSV